MRARELPGNPNEHGELLHEIRDLACEAADADPHTQVESSRCVAPKRSVFGLPSLVSRATSSLFAFLKTTLQRAWA